MPESSILTRDQARLTDLRRRTDYNDAEQRFSAVLQHRLQELIEGKRNALSLLRRYPNDLDRLGVLPTPPEVRRDELRIPVVEMLTWDAVQFVCVDAQGGPVSQQRMSDGSIMEFQLFATRFPHIVVERSDRFEPSSPEPVEITWCLRRVQNQRSQTQVNRLLDAANLAFELVRFVR